MCGKRSWTEYARSRLAVASVGRKVEAKSQVVRVRMKSGLSQAQFAAALGVSKRTLEQWAAAMQLLKIAERHPEVLLEVAT